MKPKKTVSIPDDSLHIQYLQNRDYVTSTESPLHVAKLIAFRIRGIVEQCLISMDTPLHLGRFHIDNKLPIGLNLTPYGAERYGVSRIHARLDIDHRSHLYITDLDSTNGTWVAGSKLDPYRRILVNDRDEIVLGCLVMTIYFR